MNQTAEALTDLVLAKLTTAPDETERLKAHLRPIIRELLTELLPIALADELPALLKRIDGDLAMQITSRA